MSSRSVALGVKEYLLTKIREATKHSPEIGLLEANADVYHGHLLIVMSSKKSVSYTVSLLNPDFGLKSNMGRALLKRSTSLDKACLGEDSYGA